MPRIDSDPCPPADMLDPMPQEQIFELENWIKETKQETMYQALQKHGTGAFHDPEEFPDLMPVQVCAVASPFKPLLAHTSC